ncbi:MAG: YkgJ family cysteine cluster protein [Fuerstiella sp.]|nr:YkgJ family cysteine cluster protein [Fuerstiella sp.]MCP4858485.1 YkgJ family cysteine cluster protein [Fuerstiella sp.]
MRIQVKREDLKLDEVLCQHCTGKCCRYFALPLETPKIQDDYDHIRWYMMHGSVSVFVDDGSWYIMVHADCQHLQPDNMCGAYDTRPGICRSYTTDDCEYDSDAAYDQLFETPEQIREYAHAVLPPKPRRTANDPVNLPVIGG